MIFEKYILLFVAVFLGGLVAFYFKKNNKQLLQLVLSFCGAYILGITALHLLPEVYAPQEKSIGLWILGGFFFQLMMEQFSRGVEHGHIHEHEDHSKFWFATQVMFGLGIHAFLEGMPLVNNQLQDAHHHISSQYLFYGVILHKAPEAFALVLLLIVCNYPKKIIWLCLIVFSSMSPLGAMLASTLQWNSSTMTKVLALVIGSLLHIATTILFEIDSTAHHSISWKKIAAILLGIAISLISLLQH